MVLLEFLLGLLALACVVALLIILAKMDLGKKKEEAPKKYVPPRTPNLPEGGPVLHIRTHGLAIFWHEIGAPKEIGTQVEVNMDSGRIGIYELRNIEPATGTDWSWYDFEFVRYKDTAPSPKDGPARTSED